MPKKDNMNRQFILFKIMIFILAFVVISCNEEGASKLYRIQVKGLYGFVDDKGETIIAPKYRYVSNFSDDGYALVITAIEEGFRIENGHRFYYEAGNEIHYGIIDRTNHIVIDTTLITYKRLPDSICTQFNNGELRFDEIILPEYEPSNGFFRVKTGYNNLSGVETSYKNIKNGRIVDAYDLGHNRLFRPSYGGKDILDSKGNAIVTDTFGSIGYEYGHDKINPLYYNRSLFKSAIYKQGKKWVRTSLDNYYVLSKEDISFYNGDQDAVVDAEVAQWLLIDTCGQIHKKLICIGKYGLLYEGDDLSIMVNCSDSICELINQYELTGVRFKLDDGHYLPLSEGYFGLKKSWGEQFGWAFCNSELTHRSPEIYEDIKPFKNGLAAVKINGKWGYVDHSFQLVIPNDYDDCGNFDNGWAYFMKVDSKGKHEGYIDEQGHIVWQTMRKK